MSRDVRWRLCCNGSLCHRRRGGCPLSAGSEEKSEDEKCREEVFCFHVDSVCIPCPPDGESSAIFTMGAECPCAANNTN